MALKNMAQSIDCSSNAGIMGPTGSILDKDMDSFDHTMAVNVCGLAFASNMLLEPWSKGRSLAPSFARKACRRP